MGVVHLHSHISSCLGFWVISTTHRFVLLVVESHTGHRVEAHPHGGGQHQGDAEERQVPDVLVFDVLL